MNIGDIPEEIAHAIYNAAYRDGFVYGSKVKEALPDTTFRKKRLAEYHAWLLKQAAEMHPKAARVDIDPISGVRH